MQLTLTGRHYEITPHLREYVTKKFNKLIRFDHQILKSEVIIFRDRTHDVAEGKVHAGHFIFTAKGEGNDIYQAVNDLADKIVVQIERHQEKIRSRRRRANGKKSASP